AVAAALVRAAVGRAAVAVDDVAVVAGFTAGGVDGAVAAQPLDAHRLVRGAGGAGRTDQALRTLHARRLRAADGGERSDQRENQARAAHELGPLKPNGDGGAATSAAHHRRDDDRRLRGIPLLDVVRASAVEVEEHAAGGDEPGADGVEGERAALHGVAGGALVGERAVRRAAVGG